MAKKAVTDYGTILYDDVGEGLPLIFLHGVLSNANTWRKVIKPLSEHFRCIVPTLPLGAHDLPIDAVEPITGHTISHILKQLADHLALETFVLIGNDTGGAYAQIFTSQYPERVSHLILTNCDGFEVFPPKPFKPLETAVNIPFFTDVMGLMFRSRHFARSKFALGALSEQLDGRTIQQLYLHNFIRSEAVRRDCKQVILGWNAQETIDAARKLQTFPRPVLIIWGLRDRDLFPIELGRRIAQVFSQVEFRTVDNSSTYLQEDNPEELIRLIRAFLPEMINA